MRRAQVASQQGSYLASLFNANRIPPTGGTHNLAAIAAPFKYHHSGSFAYIGGDRAVLEVASNPGAAQNPSNFYACVRWRQTRGAGDCLQPRCRSETVSCCVVQSWVSEAFCLIATYRSCL